MELTLATYSKASPAFSGSSGPFKAKLAIVGEAWGEQEDLARRPFFGASGQELTKMLKEAGLDRSQAFLTNTFAFRPQDNNLELFQVSKAEASQTLPMFRQGKYFPAKLEGELSRLAEELSSVQPNLVLALGSVACWALLGSSRIAALRGTIAASTLVPGLKVLPTYHPSAVLRDWSLRPIVIADFLKAARQQEFSEIRRPRREILVYPTLSELAAWKASIPADAMLACDIETFRSTISMVGFAQSSISAVVVPFLDGSGNYWKTLEEELEAWQFVSDLLSGPWPKIFQNGLYDLQYLAAVGLRPKNLLHDTMLFHHSLFPELQKGLGFLGSIYTDEVAWKLMRGSYDTNKRDE